MRVIRNSRASFRVRDYSFDIAGPGRIRAGTLSNRALINPRLASQKALGKMLHQASRFFREDPSDGSAAGHRRSGTEVFACGCSGGGTSLRHC